MNLTFLQLKKILPELNEEVVKPSRILQVLENQGVQCFEIDMEGDGGYVTSDGREYVFFRRSMRQLIYHETIAHEATHALSHYPAPFLRWRHHLEAEVLSLIMMMPKADLPRLNRIKHQLDDESYELLQKRNKANEIWRL